MRRRLSSRVAVLALVAAAVSLGYALQRLGEARESPDCASPRALPSTGGEIPPAACAESIFDLRFRGYSAGEARDLLDCYLPACRSCYAVGQLTLDVLFPIVYALLLMAAVFWLQKKNREWRSERKEETAQVFPLLRERLGDWLPRLPVAAAVADLVENLLVAYLATFDRGFAWAAPVASAATVVKWLLIALLAAWFLIAGRWIVERLVLVRVPLLSYAALLALAVLGRPKEGLPTIENLISVDLGPRLFFAGLAALLACAAIGVCFLLTWRLSEVRFGARELTLPSWVEGWGYRSIALLLLLAIPLILALWKPHAAAADEAWTASMTLAASSLAAVVLLKLISLARRWEAMRTLARAAERVLSSLGRGYDSHEEGHGLSLAIGAFLGLCYALGFTLGDPAEQRLPVPTVALVILLITLLCMILSFLAFVLDRRRIPLLAGVLAYAVGMAFLWPQSHFFAVGEAPAEGVAGAVATPGDARRARLARRSEENAGSVLTVVSLSGGGIQAAGWSTQVLTGLQEALGADFTRSIHLISSTSGGSVGAMFFLEGFTDPSGAPPDEMLGKIRDAAIEPSLDEAAWGLVFPDFLRAAVPILPGLQDGADSRDRGWAMERAWLRSLCGMRGVAAAQCARSSPSLSGWRQRTARGEIPAVIFNTTVVESGKPLLISTVDLTSIQELARSSQDLDSGPGIGDLESEFLPAAPGLASERRPLDLEVTTAARLSATFPVVSPAATAKWGDSALKTRPDLVPWHLADGGYFDNYGVSASVLWLRDLLRSAPSEAQLAKTRVLFVQVDAFPPSAERPPVLRRGWLGGLTAPIETLLAARVSSQSLRSESERGLFMEICERDPRFRCEEASFRPRSLPGSLDARDPPLSWELSLEDRQRLRRDWLYRANRRQVEKIRGFLRRPESASRTPDARPENPRFAERPPEKP
ncbi:MAG: hypothetical protein AAF725_17630 [Acidobacteriota bacterium]